MSQVIETPSKVILCVVDRVIVDAQVAVEAGLLWVYDRTHLLESQVAGCDLLLLFVRYRVGLLALLPVSAAR